jgi:hypothetical protein
MMMIGYCHNDFADSNEDVAEALFLIHENMRAEQVLSFSPRFGSSDNHLG